MKKSIIIFCLLTLIGFIGTTYAQDVVKEKTTLTLDQQKAVEEVISMDPKMSAEEKEQIKKAVIGAPTHAEAVSDQKEIALPEIEGAPTKAEPNVEREEVKPDEIMPGASSASNNTQPEGKKLEHKTNYHQKGSNNQPIGAPSANKPNYREKKGPNTQPEPNKPNGK